jgi:phosphohistidine phosphatase
MRLILMRHAEPESGAAVATDADRRLTEAGHDTARRIGGALRKMGIHVDRVYTSPLIRARQTAEDVAEGLGCDEAVEESDALGFGFSVYRVLELLQDAGEKSTVLCVGHAPDMNRLAASCIDREGMARLVFKKAAFCGIEFVGKPEAGAGVLQYLFRPNMLLKLLD